MNANLFEVALAETAHDSCAASPSARGSRTEAEVALALSRVGKHVFVPLWAAHSRIDLIFVDDDGCYRVQCKTARRVGDVLMFMTCSNTGNVPKNYDGQVDFFGVYSPDLDQVFLVPVNDLPTRAATLRITPTRNGQRSLIRWAKDYRIGSG